MSNNQKREGILEAITRPLGFYALALLIVESFLIIVLTKGNLDAKLQAEGMRCGVGLVFVVIFIVSLFVYYRPDNLIFTGKERLQDKGRFGTDTLKVSPEEKPRGGALDILLGKKEED